MLRSLPTTIRSAAAHWAVLVFLALGAMSGFGASTVEAARIAEGAAAEELPHIPRINGVKIDGRIDDWADRGHRIGLLSDVNGLWSPDHGFGAAARMAWDDRGLLVWFEVKDADRTDSRVAAELWRGDSVEVFVLQRRGDPSMIQAIVAPWRDGRILTRFTLHDLRNPRGGPAPLNVQAAAAASQQGYVVELRFDWAALGLTPQVGDDIAVQLAVNGVNNAGSPFRATWHPRGDTWRNHTSALQVRLSDRGGATQSVVHVGRYNHKREPTVAVAAASTLAGKEVELVLDGKVIATSILPGGAFPAVEMTLPLEAAARRGQVAVRVAGVDRGKASFQAADRQRTLSLMDATFEFPSILRAHTDPPVPRLHEVMVENGYAGPVESVFINARHEIVDAPDAPGFYGLRLTARHGSDPEAPPVVRYLSFYRLAAFPPVVEIDRGDPGMVEMSLARWWSQATDVPEKTIEARLQAEPRLAQYLYHTMLQIGNAANHISTSVPQTLLWLAIAPPMAEMYDRHEGFTATARQWWVQQRQFEHGGAEELGTRIAVAPADPPAPTLRRGDPEQAGMDADVVHALDAFFAGWLEPGQGGRIDDAAIRRHEFKSSVNSTQAVSVVLARHGVVFYAKAFGTDDLDQSLWMYGLSHAFAGAATMMHVDRGALELDDELSQFLPPLAGIEVPTPLTFRHLHTHTSGLPARGRGSIHDIVHRVAPHHAFLAVGKEHNYPSTLGVTLSGKALELLNGESMPQVYRRLLLEPLGLEHTLLPDDGCPMSSSAPDVATFGQMLLNGGAYGKARFFSQAHRDAMLPKPLKSILGEETLAVWGIGLAPATDLGPHAYGQPISGGSIFAVDPDRELVIAVARREPCRDVEAEQRKLFAILRKHALDQ